jgi:hypothetical protein
MFRKPLPARRDRSDEFASFEPRAREPAPPTLPQWTPKEKDAAKQTWYRKLPDRKSTAIRESAKGEDCAVRIPGGCTFDPEKTIWSHAPLGAAGKGRSIKALDLCGAYACTSCDAIVDGQRPLPEGVTRLQAMLAWHDGHMRSLVLLRQKGLV